MRPNPVEQSEMFKGLSEAVLKEIATFSRAVDYPRGATIFEEGDKAENVCVLDYGLVTLRIETPASEEKVMVTAIRDAGEVFGWSALIEPYVYTSTAVCLEASKVTIVEGSALKRLLEENPAAGYVVMKNVSSIVASRLRKARNALISALAPGVISHG
jgi:CRP-like cAMP-binding protein